MGVLELVRQSISQIIARTSSYVLGKTVPQSHPVSSTWQDYQGGDTRATHWFYIHMGVAYVPDSL